MSGGSTTLHCPQAMRHVRSTISIAQSPLAAWQLRYTAPLPPAHNNSAAGHTQCSVVQSTKQCGTTQNALVVQRGTQGAVGK